MKILHTVEYYYPSKGGAQEVVRQLSERMVKLGHDVTVATTKLSERQSKLINGVKIEEFDIRGNEVVGMAGETKRYQDYLVNGKFDVVMNYAAQQWATDLMFDVIDQVPARKILVPCGYSALYNPDFKAYFEKLPKILKKYAASIYMSDSYQDYLFAKDRHVNNLVVIPNGADETEFNNLADSNFRDKYGIYNLFLLTLGNHTGSKGHAETIELFRRLPYAATLVIIGNQAENGCYAQCLNDAKTFNAVNRRKKIMLLSLPRQDTVAALKSADVFIFLSNVEASPLVLFEAAAAGLPFITTDVGNAKEIVKWTQGGLVVDTRVDQARAGNVKASIDSALEKLTWLISNKSERQQMGQTARSRWQERFTWQKITEQYINLYEGKV